MKHLLLTTIAAVVLVIYSKIEHQHSHDHTDGDHHRHECTHPQDVRLIIGFDYFPI